jgi:hypothetical protein
MSMVIITYEAKCKHCLFFEYENIPKKNGSKSKINRAFCKNTKSNMYNQQLILKSKACEKLEL